MGPLRRACRCEEALPAVASTAACMATVIALSVRPEGR
jgi:hypothetical protein